MISGESQSNDERANIIKKEQNKIVSHLKEFDGKTDIVKECLYVYLVSCNSTFELIKINTILNLKIERRNQNCKLISLLNRDFTVLKFGTVLNKWISIYLFFK
jgi:hypothetical protein